MRASVPLAWSLVAARSLPAQRPTIPSWTLSPTPTWSVGGSDADTIELSGVVWVGRLASGNTFAYDRGARAIRLFSPDGKPIGTFGRRGSGPGELQFPAWMASWHDTLFAVDLSTARLSRFSSTGTYLSGAPIPAAMLSRYAVAGRLRTGAWVLRSSETTRGQQGRNGVFRDEVDVAVAADLSTPSASPVARVRGHATLYRSRGSGSNASVTVSQAALAPPSIVLAGHGTMWIGDGATDSLVALTADGRRVAVVRVPWPARAVTADIVQRERERWRARSSDAQWQAAIDVSFAEGNVPEMLPRFGSALVDDEGRLWVGSYVTAPDDAIEYAIFAPDGRPLARLAPPPRVRVRAAGSDWVLGVHVDEDEVESIREYRLRTR